jgi:hypothetical protein
MPSSKVKTTPEQWRRVGAETQESRYHRVQAQRDLVDEAWRFVAVRRGDGIRPCVVLGTHEKASEARAQCEADEYEFHWPTGSEQHAISKAALGLKDIAQHKLHIVDRAERKEARKQRRVEKRMAQRMESWKT